VPAAHRSPATGRWVARLLLCGLGCAVLALAGGRTRNADLLNYHFYNGYALLEGRLDQDIAAAGPYTYLNPLLDSLHYLGYRHVTPIVLVAVLGFVQGLNIVLVWAIAHRVLRAHGPWLPPLAALLAATGQNAVSLLGTPFGDNTVSIPALAALLLMVGEDQPRPVSLLLAGAAAGGAVGLKLTMASPYAGLGVLAAWLALRWRRPGLVAAFAGGSVIGWSLTNGWWALELWRRFGNPFFPFLNEFFRSPFAAPVWLADDRWPPREILDWLRPPVDAALGVRHRLQEAGVQDPRLLLPLLALVPWALRGRPGRRTAAPSPRSTSNADLVVFWLSAYGTWVGVFHYYRYATVLEMTAPVLALALLAEAWPRRIVAVAPLLALVLMLTTSVGRWNRDRGWVPQWFNPRLPKTASDRGQLVLLLDATTSFAAPFFPAETIFIGLAYGSGHGPAMKREIAERLRHHQGPIRALQRQDSHREVLESWGLAVVHGTCAGVRLGPTGGPLQLCRLERLPSSAHSGR
jgi:hypothetical protein